VHAPAIAPGVAGPGMSLPVSSLEALAQATSLPAGPNRESLLAGLRDAGGGEATPPKQGTIFSLHECTDAEFSVLCQAVVAVGPSVKKVVVDGYSRDALQATLFSAALGSCSALEVLELRG
jgi:hypothetical protein